MLDHIVDALNPTLSDTVIEVGPGRGSLTDALAQRCGRLVAIELDRALAALLRDRYAANAAIQIVQANVLKTDFGALGGDDYLLIGNVPYYITTPILFHAFDGVAPRCAVFLVQREVVERAIAAAGSRIYGALSVNLQAAAHVERMFDVPASAFRPPPKVTSSVIRLTPLEQPLVPAGERARFRSFVQAVFSQRRKQLGTILRSFGASALDAPAGGDISAVFEQIGTRPSERPEQLTPQQFVALFRAVGQRER